MERAVALSTATERISSGLLCLLRDHVGRDGVFRTTIAMLRHLHENNTARSGVTVPTERPSKLLIAWATVTLGGHFLRIA